MMRTASEMLLRSDVNAPVAPGAPRMPSMMCLSRVVPTRVWAVDGLNELREGSAMATYLPRPSLYPGESRIARNPCLARPMAPSYRPRPLEKNPRRRTTAMAMTDRAKEILHWYASDNVGVKTNLARLINHGALAGTGKFVILPVDQGFEHGPARSFAPNPPAYDPDYHFQLAIDSGCNAYAAPLGFLEASADKFVGQIPLILKLNNSDVLAKIEQPISAVTAGVKDAMRLGCSAIGYTIYPGSGARNLQYEELRGLVLEAKEHGLP